MRGGREVGEVGEKRIIDSEECVKREGEKKYIWEGYRKRLRDEI